MELIRFNVESKFKDKFKEYCISRDTTMSKVLIDYIGTLLNKNAGNSPGEEKNSVKTYYCGCGLDLSTLSTQDRIDHVSKCKAIQKE